MEEMLRLHVIDPKDKSRYLTSKNAVDSLLMWYKSRGIHPSLWKGQLKGDLVKTGYELSETDVITYIRDSCSLHEWWFPV